MKRIIVKSWEGVCDTFDTLLRINEKELEGLEIEFLPISNSEWIDAHNKLRAEVGAYYTSLHIEEKDFIRHNQHSFLLKLANDHSIHPAKELVDTLKTIGRITTFI